MTDSDPPPQDPLPENDEALPEIEDFDMPEFEVTPEMAQMFTTESEELLDSAEQSLLQLQINEGDATEALNEAFRCVHSFKGNCGFFQLADYERLSHTAENLLDSLKSGELKPINEIITALLETVDLIRNGLGDYAEDSANKQLEDFQVLVERLEALHDGEGQEAGGDTEAEPEQQASEETSDPTEPKTESKKKTTGQKSIRVDIDKLDSLINLVGELVIAESMVTRHPAVESQADESLSKAIHQLHRVSADLQDIAMSVRMIPLTSTFRRINRLVHDLSVKCNKPVKLEMLGEDTEVDKTVIETISDPLVHIVRNAIDHGLEAPGDRVAIGKPEQGQVRISAKHESGEVWISVSEDGRGLDSEKLIAKAREKDILQGDSPEPSEEEAFQLIFHPGFSTAKAITDVSGRGVGMDVVRQNIENINGRIDLHSTFGEGTTFTLRIPLTMAIIDGMLVKVGGSQYTIPILSIRESIRVKEEQVTITPDGQELVRLREELIPVLRLHQAFEQETDVSELVEGILIVVEIGGKSVGLFVDDILGQQETVIKGLSGYLGSSRGISGCTILGDGTVSLILDIPDLVGLGSRQ